ncbi:hypothetical protein [Ornithinimicrobium panacihumi]|uniref:hypothetical protein n=1 Tax=Ornithinimicrobium panacihumi TaxID=2008449 RepID=UPI003F8CB58D
MASTLPDVVAGVAVVWQELPAEPDWGGARRGGGPVASDELSRVVEQSQLLTALAGDRPRWEQEHPRVVPHAGQPGEDGVGLLPVVNVLCEMQGGGSRSTDPVEDRVALMEILHHCAHAANVAIGSRVSELTHSSSSPEQREELLRYLRVSTLVEEVAGSYGRRARPDELGGPHKEPTDDAQNLGAFLSRLDVLTQRHLAGADRASDLAQVAGPQATIYAGSRVILAAGMEAGIVPTNEHLLRRVDEARDTWMTSRGLWLQMTPRSDQRPHPELWASQRQVVQALRDTLTPTGRAERAQTIARRADLGQLTEVVHQHLATVPLHAQLLREAALDPQMRYSARGIDALVTTLQRQIEERTGVGQGYGLSDLGRAPVALRSRRDAPSPLPDFVRPELEKRAGELVHTSTAAYVASGQSWTQRTVGLPREATYSHAPRTPAPAQPRPTALPR